uniref:Sugar transporter SWEET1 n=1 Tax=Anopheles dirus TaxID=7168 RepID=A0A182NSS6_9DIPT
MDLSAVLAGLEPYRERIGQAAGLLTVTQYLAGWFICTAIRRQGTSAGVSPLRFIGGCGLSILQVQYSQKLQAPALVWTGIFTLLFSAIYSVWFWWYTPANLRRPFYRLAVGTTAATAGLYAYGAQGDSPEVMYRLGMVLTALALAFIALPLAQLGTIIRAKSSAGLPLPAILASTGATILWLLYGLLINNTFIVVINRRHLNCAFEMEAISQALQPYKEVVGMAAGVLTVGQMFSGCFVCNDIRKKGTTDGFSAMPFVGGCGLTVLFLQHGMLMNDSAMTNANLVGLAISIIYATFFLLYTPPSGRSAFWRQVGGTILFTLTLLGYVKIENPAVVEDRFGIIITVLMLCLIGQPLFGLPDIIRRKSTEGLPFAMILSGTIVGLSWLLYGVILNNVFVVLQNVAGVTLSGIQLALFAIYPSKPVVASKKRE